MFLKSVRCLMFAGVLAGAGRSLLAADSVGFDTTALEQVPVELRKFVERGQAAGIVSLIASKDQVIRVDSVGKSDLAASREMTPDTIFRIASMTKPITAVALMMLVEEGKLSIEAPVAKYIPSFRTPRLKDGTTVGEVTIRQVLAHIAGLPQPSRDAFESKSLEQIVDTIGSSPLEFVPGTKWQYSSGVTVAGRLIEVASGLSYAEFLEQRIFKPLAMNDTTFRLSALQAARLAVTYKPGKEAGTLEPVKIADPMEARTPNPSGGLYSTAADQAKFLRAILNGGSLGTVKLISPEGVQALLANQSGELITGFTPGNYWGLGWCVLRSPQGVTRLLSPGTHGHGGAFGTQGWIDPARDLVLVLMVNRMEFGNSDGSDIRDVVNEVVIKARRGVANDGAKFAAWGNYRGAIELSNGSAKAIICPDAGGRVLSFSSPAGESLFLDPAEKDWQATSGSPVTAGRFDVGPELITKPHPKLWSGTWTAEITGQASVRLVSARDDVTGLQLAREYQLVKTPFEGAAGLICRQTIMNISGTTKTVCHWGRSFSPGGGVCIVPLAGDSKFPSKYVMYEDSALVNVRPPVDENIRERDGCLEILGPPRKPKLGFDSTAGWLAYTLPSGGLFIKRFKTYPDRPYSEAAGLTLSVWYPQGPRIELEPIGPRETLKPGETASFTEEWYLSNIIAPQTDGKINLDAIKTYVNAVTSAP